jgi:hypothetical protein
VVSEYIAYTHLQYEACCMNPGSISKRLEDMRLRNLTMLCNLTMACWTCIYLRQKAEELYQVCGTMPDPLYRKS